MRYLSIKNFDKHQHYKDRRPPWIKLHAEVLDDYEFLCLQDASKAHLMLLWVLASKLDNRIPYDLGFISKKLGCTSPVDVEELVLQGFISVSQDDSKPLAGRKQSAMPETETETEREKKKPKSSANAEPTKTWVQEGVEWWTANVGRMTHPRFGAALKPAVDARGPEVALAGVRRWVEDAKKRNRVVKVEYFAEDWVKWCKEPETVGALDEGAVMKALGLVA